MPRRDLLHHQLRTVALSHAACAAVAASRPALWLQGAAAAGRPLPVVLARDLGLLLTRPLTDLELVKPGALPFDDDTTLYLRFLERVADHPLIRQLSAWRPPLSDPVVAVLVARFVDGLDLPDSYLVPAGAAGVVFTRHLGARLAEADPVVLWQSTPAAERPRLAELLPASSLARIERNLGLLDSEEVRFLAHYGPPLAGSPDPRELVDMLELTGLPASARLALTQTLKLLPRVSAERTVGGLQTYPEGGYEGLSRRGSLDSLLPSELAFPPELVLHRIANREALYYGRESPRERRRELAYVVAQTGRGLGGDGEVVAKALVLALAQTLRRRGYEVLYSLAGRRLEEPLTLARPAEVARLLHYRTDGRADAGAVLSGVLGHLRSWRDTYRGRQVVWVVSEDFDADEAETHRALYHALGAEAGQQAWYVRVGANGGGRPATAGLLGRWQTVETEPLIPPLPEAERTVKPRRRWEPEPGDLWVDPVLGMEFSYIPPGTFQIGSPEDEAERLDWETQHEVTLTQGYWMSRTAVTQGQFERFVAASAHEADQWWRQSGGESHPVVYVSWHDAQAFCEWLTGQSGEEFRLPTEAEWEYAARAGTTGPFWTGVNLTTDQANYNGNHPYADRPKGEYRRATVPVKSFVSNPWSLYEVHGNVWEWVEDWRGEYPAEAVEDPGGPERGAYRVLRGGSWDFAAAGCRSACRDKGVPENRNEDVGFRIVRILPTAL